MNIGLDFDDTFTEDPELWRQFVASCSARGHLVFVTTARFSNNLADIERALPGIEVIASNGGMKGVAAKAAGVTIDVWIDDMPELVR